MSDPSAKLARFMLELVNCVGDGPYLDAVKRARISHERPLASGQREHFQIDAASAEDANVLRGQMTWIKHSSHLAGLGGEVVITEPARP